LSLTGSTLPLPTNIFRSAIDASVVRHSGQRRGISPFSFSVNFAPQFAHRNSAIMGSPVRQGGNGSACHPPAQPRAGELD
jgi:hypothetical protein